MDKVDITLIMHGNAVNLGEEFDMPADHYVIGAAVDLLAMADLNNSESTFGIPDMERQSVTFRLYPPNMPDFLMAVGDFEGDHFWSIAPESRTS
jgi:hypothetical protein